MGVNYDEIMFSPKFPVTHYTELRYLTGYEISSTKVDVRYILKENGMRYDMYSPAKKVTAHILLPEGKNCSKLIIDGKEKDFIIVIVGTSKYVDFDVDNIKDKKISIEILF